ncbi:MAG TPA: 4,5-dihydroxyphthalate decarboxylase, partial [Alphaproteobacteria bacterium]|nr:4,5-dihydroxyphthalate decarboxylase [Alphaproteobacteria bacterium]
DDANRNTLQTFLDHHHRQGLSSRALEVDELFPVNAVEAYSL